MKATDYAGTNALIRVYETRLLRNEQFETMLQASSFEEAVNVLKDSSYRQDVEKIKENKDYELLIDNEMQRTFKELFEISPEPRLIEFFSLRYSYHNLKILLKAKLVGENFDYLLLDIGKEPLSALRHVVEAGKSEVLHPIIIEALEDALDYYEEYHNIQAIDIILDRFYFRHIKALSLELNEPKIIELANLFIDFNNLSILCRAIDQKQTRNFLHAVLSSSGDVSKATLIELASEDLGSLSKKLMKLPYKTIIQAATNSETRQISPIKIDLETDNSLMKFFQMAKFEVFGPMPILAYLYAKQTEVRNLRLILVGKKNQIPQDSLRERMRLNYGA